MRPNLTPFKILNCFFLREADKMSLRINFRDQLGTLMLMALITLGQNSSFGDEWQNLETADRVCSMLVASSFGPPPVKTTKISGYSQPGNMNTFDFWKNIESILLDSSYRKYLDGEKLNSFHRNGVGPALAELTRIPTGRHTHDGLYLNLRNIIQEIRMTEYWVTKSSKEKDAALEEVSKESGRMEDLNAYRDARIQVSILEGREQRFEFENGQLEEAQATIASFEKSYQSDVDYYKAVQAYVESHLEYTKSSQKAKELVASLRALLEKNRESFITILDGSDNLYFAFETHRMKQEGTILESILRYWKDIEGTRTVSYSSSNQRFEISSLDFDAYLTNILRIIIGRDHELRSIFLAELYAIDPFGFRGLTEQAERKQEESQAAAQQRRTGELTLLQMEAARAATTLMNNLNRQIGSGDLGRALGSLAQLGPEVAEIRDLLARSEEEAPETSPLLVEGGASNALFLALQLAASMNRE
jgi:hypothetical protein